MKTKEPTPPADAPRPRWRITLPRDTILFIFGLAVLWHEVFVVDTAEPLAVTIGLGLAGSPLWLRIDEARRGKRSGEGES